MVVMLGWSPRPLAQEDWRGHREGNPGVEGPQDHCPAHCAEQAGPGRKMKDLNDKFLLTLQNRHAQPI